MSKWWFNGGLMVVDSIKLPVNPIKPPLNHQFNSLLLKMTIEIVDLPIENGDFP